MDVVSTKKKLAAIDILNAYSGNNPYILLLKHQVTILGATNYLNSLTVEYILKNHNFEPKVIGKAVSILQWYGEKLQKDFTIDFTPQKIAILALLGETKDYYHCIIKYRQMMDPIKVFVPKNAILENFLVGDYSKINVDFERYDRLSSSKDENRKLLEHQKEAIKFLLGRKKCILADDMGLGKTTSLAVASIEGNFDSVLIICPASLKTNWKRELMWYVPERDITIVEGFIGKNKPELEEYLGYKVGASRRTVKELQEEAKERGKWVDNRFVIINFNILDEFYEKPETRSKDNIDKAFANSPMLQYIANKKSLVIIDEAHKLSNNDSGWYENVKDMLKRANPDSIYLATGTPVTNNPQNYFNLLQLIGAEIADDWIYFSKQFCDARKIPAKGEKYKWTQKFLELVHKDNWYQLTDDQKDELKEYINKHARMITITTGSSNLDELQMKTAHLYLRRLKEDAVELPEKKIHEIFYDLTLEQMFQYNMLWDEYVLEQKKEDPNKELNKELHEGAVYRKYCSNEMVPNTIKLAEYYINRGEKVVIACCYDEELYTLKAHFGDKCVIYNGKMSAKEKDASEYAFMNDDSKMVFIGNIVSAGVGITLTSAHILIFNNIDFVPGNCRQMQDRIHRIGQKHKVDIYYQMFKGTQYEKIWNTVMKKELVINSIIKKEDEK